MTRAEKVALIQSYREHGYSNADIALILGTAVSTVRNLFNDPDGSKQKERRKRYQGSCEDCGAPTDGSGGYGAAPKHCKNCAPKHYERTVWTRELIIARIHEWFCLYGEPPGVVDWNPYHAETVLHDRERSQRWMSRPDHWPWMSSVYRQFGSWNAAIEAAGFSPRPSHGGGGNQSRRRAERAKAELAVKETAA